MSFANSNGNFADSFITYNFCRFQQTMKVSTETAAWLTNPVWSVSEPTIGDV